MNKQIIIFLWNAVKSYKGWMAIMMIAPITSTTFGFAFNYATKLMVDIMSTKDHITFEMGIMPILYLLGGLLIPYLFWTIHNVGQLKVYPFLSQNITSATFARILKNDYNYFENIPSGSIVSKVKGITDGWWNLWSAIAYELVEPVSRIIISSGVFLFFNIKLFLIVIIFFIISLPLSQFFFLKASKLNQIDKENYHKIMGFISDKITNIFSLFSFAKKRHEINALKDFYKSTAIPAAEAFYRQNIITHTAIPMPSWAFITSIFIVTMVLYNKGEIGSGSIAFIMMTALNVMQSFEDINETCNNIIKSFSDFKASCSIILDPLINQDKPHSKPIVITKGEIIFNNISSGYGDKNILQNLNLHIKPGERIGLVGTSGAGKSTLINSLMKYIPIHKGEIFIDGQNIDNVKQDSLRAQISLIPQECMLFNISLRENIGYAKEKANLNEIIEAAKLANIHDFIESLPEKYETMVGERGVKLSGGQRQRIAIARAMIKKSSILILDEATASLDSITEIEIQKSINTLLEITKATVIAIAHRLSTIKHLDKIIVLDQGKIIEQGSFSELTQKPEGKFKELWDHQSYAAL